ncbi:MAG TPA: hypothetical protein VEB20_18015 [Azospirillaceae bacterium]|nr:hypothetical protein [Azospirillaceae bacterium]
MSEQPHFFWDYIPFWTMTYLLAAVGWTCFGRFLLAFLMGPDSPNYIMRGFRLVTEWAVRGAALITPRIVPPLLLLPVAGLWVFTLRFLLATMMLQAGMVPSLAVGAGAP